MDDNYICMFFFQSKSVFFILTATEPIHSSLQASSSTLLLIRNRLNATWIFSWVHLFPLFAGGGGIVCSQLCGLGLHLLAFLVLWFMSVFQVGLRKIILYAINHQENLWWLLFDTGQLLQFMLLCGLTGDFPVQFTRLRQKHMTQQLDAAGEAGESVPGWIYS